MTNNTIKIIVADDHPIFLEGLTSLMGSFPELQLVATAGNGKEVLEQLAQESIDVVITDVDMPVMNGMQLTKMIKQTFPNIKVLALTMHSDANIISAMIKNGADGYISKDTTKTEFITAIKTIIDGSVYYGTGIKEMLENNDYPVNQKSARKIQIKISERETEVLKCTAIGLTQQQTAEKLFISAHTVNFHRRNLFEKFDAKNTAELIKQATDQGFL